MYWCRIIPLLNLLFILIELSDPSTAFIRVSYPPSKACLVVMKNSAHSILADGNLAQTGQNDTGDSEDADPSPSDTSFGASEAHAAVLISSIIFQGQREPTTVDIEDTGLSTQYDPSILKRPPITLT